MPELWELPAATLRTRIAGGELSCLEVTESHLRRLDAIDPVVGAMLTVTHDDALAAARQMDSRMAAGEPVPSLAGIPLVLKDNLCTRGVRTTAGSRILGDWRPPYDATVVARLREAGAISLGKANCDEFAMGSSTENSAFFPTRNPWDLERVPGGSSGGSAAAVAAGMVPISLGSDTGGSIRQPASLCGIVGVKPTYGRVSRYGLIAYASSLDQVGPFAGDVRGAAMLLDAISGHDPLDSTSAPMESTRCEAVLGSDIRGLRVGVPREYYGDGVDPDIRKAVGSALEVLRALGAEVEETSTPHAEFALACYYIIAPAEASSNLARYDGVRYGPREPGTDLIEQYERTRDRHFGAEVKRRIMLGTYALSAGYYDAYYEKALRVRTLVRQDLDRCFERFDVLVTPTSPEVAFRLGAKANDPMAMKLSDICTIPVNMAGTCAASVPCGFAGGLPVGMQLIGRPFDESTLLRAAFAYEQATTWHLKRPSLSE